ncbi:MAG: hypothetical protein H7Y38_02465 [Armatimonadetes bacterium]|nr:hypothetical protein [Armatimonadota bacterium]
MSLKIKAVLVCGMFLVFGAVITGCNNASEDTATDAAPAAATGSASPGATTEKADIKKNTPMVGPPE